MNLVLRSMCASSLLPLLIMGCAKNPPEKANNHDAALPMPPACAAELTADCDNVRSKIEELRTQRDEAADPELIARTSLELNHQIELLALYESATAEPEALAALAAKYAQLLHLVESEFAKAKTTHALKDPSTTDHSPSSKDGEGRLIPAVANLLYQPSELAAVTKVFKDFGNLYINETTTDQEVTTATMPWAGYWFPFSGNDLFGDTSAPLQKLDRLLVKMGREGKTSAYEQSRYKDFPIDSWEGRCFAWALAAVTSAEPVDEVTVQDITFTSSDQKALLTKASELVPITTYGIRYDGDDVTDATFQDIRPEAFHRLVEAVIGEQHRAFVIDDDPGIQVWSKALFRMRWRVSRDPDVDNAYLVTAHPWMTKNRENTDDQATTVDDRAAPTYKYRLYIDPSSSRNGKFKVIAGEWLDAARSAHPDVVFVPTLPSTPHSSNPEIDKNLDVVRQIVGNAL